MPDRFLNMSKQNTDFFCRRSGVSRVPLLILLLAVVFFLGGCGLAQIAVLSPFSTKNKEYIPKTGDSEDILRAAARYPEAALLSPAFYKVAVPADVAMVLQKADPTQITQSEITDRFSLGSPGLLSPDFGYAVAMAILLPIYKLDTFAVDPLPVALEYSKHPEVICLLAEAGCPMRGSVATYIGHYRASARYLPFDPEMLAMLLRYEPAPENSGFLLTRLLHENDEDLSPEAVKIFLSMTRNLKLSDDRGFVVNAVKSGSLEKLQIILAAGANPNCHYFGEKSALDLAQDAGRQDMVNALLAAGARRNIPPAGPEQQINIPVRVPTPNWGFTP